MSDIRATTGRVGALFQVASQFNLLEMVSPRVTPEDGVTRYQHDRTPDPRSILRGSLSHSVRRKPPRMFTEHGVVMAATVLPSMDTLAFGPGNTPSSAMVVYREVTGYILI